MENTFGIHGSGSALPADSRGSSADEEVAFSAESDAPDAIPFVRVIKNISSLTALMESLESGSDKAASASARPADSTAAPGRGRLVFASTLQQPVQDSAGASDAGISYQTELCEIFGVEGVMDAGEILRHAGALPGITQVERVQARDIPAIEATQRQLAALSLGLGELTLSVGGATIEFIREGDVLLAVKTEGQDVSRPYETLRMVAREVDRLTRIP